MDGEGTTTNSRPVSAASTNSDQPPANAKANQGDSGFEEMFRVFAKFGDSKSTGDAITLSNSDKWFKQAKVIDGKKITTVDTGIYFKQIAKTRKSLGIKEYNQFLEKIATNKKMDLEEIKHKLSTTGPPSTTKTTTAANTGAVARLTDHTKYTGTHKQRFDESGKGRGKAGREDKATDGFGWSTWCSSGGSLLLGQACFSAKLDQRRVDSLLQVTFFVPIQNTGLLLQKGRLKGVRRKLCQAKKCGSISLPWLVARKFSSGAT